MAEEKQKKKKLKIIAETLRWFTAGLIAILLIALLYFQAPWKVIGFFAFILLNYVILSMKLLKWFWFGVSTVVVVLIIWVFLPDGDDSDWRPYKFEEEFATLEAKRAIGDEENAAEIYTALFDTDVFDGNEPNFLMETNPSAKSGPWVVKEHPQASHWLSEHQWIVDKLLEAAEIEKCYFSTMDDSFFSLENADKLRTIRQLGQLLVISANNDMAEGRIDEALEKCFCLFKMGKHVQQQPLLVDMLAGLSIDALGTGRLKDFVVTGEVDEKHFDTIEKALAESRYDWSSNWPRMLDYEKLMAKNTFAMITYEVNSKGKTRLGRNPMKSLRKEFKKEVEETDIEKGQSYWMKKEFKATTILGWFFMPSSPKKLSEIVDESYEKYYAIAEIDYDWSKEPMESSLADFKLNLSYLFKTLADILAKAYYRIYDTSLRNTSEKNGGMLLIGLRRYKNKEGRWPESLEQIKELIPEDAFVDPHNGGDFVYKLTEDGFTLYSKGKNDIDEDGEYNPRWPEEAKPDDRLIWPVRPGDCGSKEEKEDVEQQ